MRDEYLWRLISHLSLNHLTLTDSATGAETLREILRLYNPSDQDEHRKAIDSIQSVSYRRGVGQCALSRSARSQQHGCSERTTINWLLSWPGDFADRR